MNDGFGLLDLLTINNSDSIIDSKLQNLTKKHGTLDRNINLHLDLLNKIPEFSKAIKDGSFKSSSAFDILVKKIVEIEKRIDTYLELMLESSLRLPKSAYGYIRLQDLVTYLKKDKTLKINTSAIVDLEQENKSLNHIISVQNNKIKTLKRKSNFTLSALDNKDLELIADQTRKKNGSINYSRIGRELGVSRDTVKREIFRRSLTYLI